ncbi:D-Ala-D-Ala carboxypeptidase family metallohydrolase [Psychrobacter sp. AH5]|uniref:D-Ala-D-Ala carboxypeptidase family metallohydrolase n=1 Tax=Psychrobacter sp. AH5 TaxID=2937433 RepID=UPI003341DF5E
MNNTKNNDDNGIHNHHRYLDQSYLKTAKSNKTTATTIATIGQLTLAAIVCASSLQAHAAILNDSSERRIQVRQGSANPQVYIAPASNPTNSNYAISGDSLQGLIEQKSRQYHFDAQLSIEESKRLSTTRRAPSYNTTYNTQYINDEYYGNSAADFQLWLSNNRFRAQEVANYQRYLSSRLGAQNVPPLEQLLTTARSWNRCGYEPFQLPPQELWANIVPTLRLYSQLKTQGILPRSTEIRSVYRSPNLNDCAGGADNSKHMTAGAMDIWVPEYDGDLWQLSRMQDSLCQFWQYQGQSMDFGLGLYSTGAIHLDTQGYRKWGFNNTSSSFACRY